MKRLLLRYTARLPEPLRDLLLGRGEDARAGLGALFSFGIRVASAGIAFASHVLLARWLGAFEFGVYTYVWVWVNFLGLLCTAGLSIAAVRFLAEYRKPEDHGLARGFLRFGRLVSLGAGFVAAGLGILAIRYVPALREDHYATAMMIGLLALPAMALTDFQDGVGRARSWIGLAFLPPYILRPLLILVLVAIALVTLGERSAVLAAASLTIAAWLTAGVQFVLQHRRFVRELKPERPVMQGRQWIAVSLPMLIMDGFTLLMLNLDVMLLELFVSPDRIAVYFAAARTITLIAFIHFAVTAVAMPRFATAYAERDVERAARQLARFRNWTLWPSLAAAAVLLLAGRLILSMFGAEFVEGWPLMFVLTIGYLARAAAGPAESMLVVSGHQNHTAMVTGLAALVNGLLNLLLIPSMGLMGAATATTTAFVLQAGLFALAARRVLQEGFDGPAPAETAGGRA